MHIVRTRKRDRGLGKIICTAPKGGLSKLMFASKGRNCSET